LRSPKVIELAHRTTARHERDMKRDKDFVLLGSTASGDAGEGAPRRKDSLRDGLREFLKAHDKELCEDCGCCERDGEA
jgi:hypothetical protein